MKIENSEGKRKRDARKKSNYLLLTSYERDDETDLEYAQARMYNYQHGRFTNPDPLYYAASRPVDPQQFNLYSYVRNNPLILIDPDGKDLRARSVDKNGDLIDLTTEDRKALQKQLRKLSPGVKVKKNGDIVFRGNPTASAGARLISGLINAKDVNGNAINVTIGVNHNNDTSADPVNADLTTNQKVKTYGGISDTLVLWDPNAVRTTEVRDSANSQIYSQESSSAIILGHELIHAYNDTRGEIPSGQITGQTLTIPVGNVTYSDNASALELRAVGLMNNQAGDITENQLREQLSQPPRISYNDRKYWTLIGSVPRKIGSPPPLRTP